MTKRYDPMTSNKYAGTCDCWICRYSTTPNKSGDCPHPRLSHVGDEDKKREYLRALVAQGGSDDAP